MNKIEVQLISSVQNYDITSSSAPSTSDSTVFLDSTDELEQSVLDIFSKHEHDMVIYETQTINENTIWVFLKCEDNTKNIYAQVICLITK